MADLSDQNIERLLRSMDASLAELARRGGTGAASSSSSSRSTRSSIEMVKADSFERELRSATRNLSGFNKVQKKLNEVTDEFLDVVKQGGAETKRGKELQELHNKLIKESSSYINEQAVEYNKLVNKTLPEQLAAFDNIIKGSNNFTSSLAKSQRNASLLGAALIKSHSQIDEGSLEYATYINNLTKTAGSLDKSFLRRAKMVDELTDEMSDSLDVSDFAQLRIQLGDAQTVLAENIAKLKDFGIGDAGSLQDMVTNNKGDLRASGGMDKIHSVLVESLSYLSAQGHSIGEQFENLDDQGNLLSVNLEKLTNTSTEELAKKLKELNDNITGVTKGLDAEAKARNSLLGSMSKSLLTAEGRRNMMMEKLGAMASTASIIASLKKVGDGLAQLYKEVVSFNIAQIPATFAEVQLASIKMGMSFEDTVKFLQENKRTLAIYGNDYGKLNATIGKTFRQFGYNMAQASEIIGPAIESGIATGLDIRSPDKLNRFIDESMKSFQSISGIVNITGQEYMKLNSELYNSEEVTRTIAGMNASQALMYSKSLELQRNQLVVGGLSLQQAQDLVKAQEAAKREKVGSRIRGGAMLMTQMQALGFGSEDSMRAMRVHQQGARASKEDSEWLSSIQGQIGAANEKAIMNGGIGNEFLLEKLAPESANLARQQQLGLTQEINSRAGVGLSNSENAQVIDKTKGNMTVASVSDSINSISSLLQNSLSVAVMGTIGVFTGLMLQAGRLTGVLGRLAGTGGAGGTINTPTNGTAGPAKPGGGSSWKSKIGGGLGLGLFGMAASAGGQALTNSGHEKLGAGASVLGRAAEGAGLGMMLGPWGAAAGGILGAGLGAYENWGSISGASTSKGISGQPGAEAVQEIVNKAADTETGTLKVSDEDAKAQLASMAASLLEAVKILNTISENGSIRNGAPSALAGRNIPSSTAYQTGKRA